MSEKLVLQTERGAEEERSKSEIKIKINPGGHGWRLWPVILSLPVGTHKKLHMLGSGTWPHLSSQRSKPCLSPSAWTQSLPNTRQMLHHSATPRPPALVIFDVGYIMKYFGHNGLKKIYC